MALTVAGSDPSGGAGVQADLKTFAAFGVYGAAALTALTVQNTRGVSAIHALDAAFVVAQVESVLGDLSVGAMKTGMLAGEAVVAALGEIARAQASVPLVVDPVLVATSGDSLAAAGVAAAMLARLVPVARLVTPNLHEASALCGRAVGDVAGMREAARFLVDHGARAALVKGGHLPGRAVDILLDGRDWYEISAPRWDVGATHGTGCTLAAAITAALAQGRPLVDAVAVARAFVHAAIGGALAVGGGARPLDHRVRVAPGPDQVAPVEVVAYPPGS